MSLKCHFGGCQNYLPENELFDHLESCHRQILREPTGNLYFDLNFKDMQQETLALCTSKGLYWLRQKFPQTPRIFHIAESEQVEYVLKLGLKKDGHCQYLGPYISEPDNSQRLNQEQEQFNLNIQHLNAQIESRPSQVLRVYFGVNDDSDDHLKHWPKHAERKLENEHINRLCVEMFTCLLCFEYIHCDARFCENKHYVCLKCFEKITKKQTPKCPICRRVYLIDCMDNKVERILCMLKWPNMPGG